MKNDLRGREHVQGATRTRWVMKNDLRGRELSDEVGNSF